MAWQNKAELEGTVGVDPRVIENKRGELQAAFSLCWETSPTKNYWIDIMCFGEMAELVLHGDFKNGGKVWEGIRRGDQVYVQGRLISYTQRVQSKKGKLAINQCQIQPYQVKLVRPNLNRHERKPKRRAQAAHRSGFDDE